MATKKITQLVDQLEIVNTFIGPKEKKLLSYYIEHQMTAPESNLVTLSEDEIINLFGKMPNLEHFFDCLKRTMAILAHKPLENGIAIYTLFERVAVKTLQDNKICVEMQCSQRAKSEIITPEHKDILLNSINNICVIDNPTTYRMLTYLSGHDRKPWVVDMESLALTLNRDTDDLTYETFERNVLHPIQKEIEEKGLMEYIYSPVYTGNKITRIQFKVINDKPRKSAQKSNS